MMGKVAFRQLPMLVRVMTMASIFMAWVLFAEFVIDRYGWDRHIPFYRFADICPYEGVVLLGIGILWWRLHR